MDYYIPRYSSHLVRTGTNPLTEKERKAFEVLSQATKRKTDVWSTAINLCVGKPEKIRQLFRELKSQLMDEVLTMEKIIGREGIRALLTV